MSRALKLLVLSASIGLCYVMLLTAHMVTVPETSEQTKSSSETQYQSQSSSEKRTSKVALKPLGQAHSYDDEVDLRVMVLTYNRPSSLRKCLQHIQRLDMDGRRLAVEIWVDRSTNGQVDHETVTIGRDAEQNWTNGKARLHIRESNAGIVEQWVNTWRPKPGSDEIGLIIEDDIDVAPMAYRWIRGVHDRFRGHANFSGVTLQTQGAEFKVGKKRPLVANAGERAFFYSFTGTWGFSPNPVAWRRFQEWVKVAREQGVKPYIEGVLSTKWYKEFEKKGKADSVWAVWWHFYSHVNHLYCLYSNLEAFTSKKQVLLSWNRQEKGLHYGGGMSLKTTDRLLSEWTEDLINFPKTTLKFSFSGNEAHRI